MSKKKINLYFAPPEKEYFFEKSEKGQKKRYLKGISSGIQIDQHGERMTKQAITDFMKQAASKEILLFPDVHGIQATNDIGRLVQCEVLNNNDWQTTYMLYDGSEGAEEFQVQKANAVWKQINGLPPYEKQMRKGFSIEGSLDDSSIINSDEHGRRIINKVDLDGVCLVPKPAYEASIANAVFKALGEKNPAEIKKNILSNLRQKMKEREVEQDYFKSKWELADALDETVKDIMESTELLDKASALNQAFDEYKTLTVDLIMRSQALFLEDQPDETATLARSKPYGETKRSRKKMVNQLEKSIGQLIKSLQ